MELVVGALLLIVVLGGVFLWRTTPTGPRDPDDDRAQPTWWFTDVNSYWGDQMYRRRKRKR